MHFMHTHTHNVGVGLMAHIPGGQTAARAQRPLEHALFSSVQAFFIFFLFMPNSIFFHL